MIEIQVTDFLKEEWELNPYKFETNRKGMTLMWALVAKGPGQLTTPPHRYQSIPFPVFTEWWDEA